MIDALKHRGPHDSGINGDSTALFGMTRLAIRSLTDGKQPIVDSASGVMMTCNGEIDNHLELREWLLARGRTVEQTTDVAVIPCLYLELGDAFVERLRGAFAIAIWDPRTKKLLLIRDRAGERPLFFSVNDGAVAFSSLISTLVVSAAHTSTINTDAVHSYMQRGFFTSPATPFADIQKVSPGEVVTIDAAGIQRKRYWRWNTGQTIKDLKLELIVPTLCVGMQSEPLRGSGRRCVPHWVTTQSVGTITGSYFLPNPKQPGSLDAFDEIFRESVRRQSEVDVNFGLFLSGGVDSSLIAAVTRSIRPALTLKAYSLRFSEASYDEGHYAEQVADSLNIESVPVWVRPNDFPPMLAQLVRQVGEPLADPAWIPSSLLAKRAAQDVRVALVGEGADELFGGYPTYFAAGLANRYARFPNSVRSLIRRAIESWPPSDKKVTLPFLLKRFIQGDGLDFMSRHIIWNACISPVILARLGVTPPLLTESGNLSAAMLDRLQQHDLETSLAEGLLTKADRAGMKSALELRAPFLDQQVMEFAASLPEKQRVHRLQTKVFLKQYALQYLPAEIVHRKKRGLSVPLNSWLREPLYHWAKSKLASPLLDRVGVNRYVAQELLQEHKQHKADHSRSIWTLIVLSEWLEWASEECLLPDDKL